MSLEMKAMCEKCGRPLVVQDEAYICTYMLRKLHRANERHSLQTAAAN
jgi:hypothetical protein